MRRLGALALAAMLGVGLLSVAATATARTASTPRVIRGALTLTARADWTRTGSRTCEGTALYAVPT
jgi:hypothetical protein